MERLVPHLRRAAQLNRRFAEMEARAAGSDAALDRLETGMLLVDERANVTYANPSAHRMLQARDGLSVVRGVLSTAVQAESKRLRHLIAQASPVAADPAASPGGAIRTNRPSGGYEVLVAPLIGPAFAPGLTAPLAVVFVRDPAARVDVLIERLRRLYGLTAAEALLMGALLAGETLETIGEQRAVGREALRSQLKAVFGKTGTASQLALIRLGLRGVAGFR